MKTSAAACPARTLTLTVALLSLLLSLDGFCAHGLRQKNGSEEEEQKKRQPHIIFILTDDQGFNDIGYHNPSIKTPTLDKLAAEGVTLENYYVQPICTPSRSQLLTGRYQIHTGLQHSIIRPSQPSCLPPHMDTLPERLQQAGYRTHMVGKWHLGFYRKACLPTRKGFHSFFGSLTGSVDYYSYSSCDGPGLCGYDLHHNEGVAWGQEGRYSTLLFTQRARRILEEHRPADKPLFLLLSLQAVHTPLQPPKTYIYPYRDMANVARRKFAAMVSTVDEAVRNVTYALRKYGYYKNSVIIYSTDNGAQPFTGGSNWPLRGRKGTYWEGGVRGVAFVHSPLLKRRRRISKDLLHITDWFPTLVNLAGANISQTQGLDGFDVWPTISEGRESPRQEILHNIDPLHRPPAQTMKWEVGPEGAPGRASKVSPFTKQKKKLLRQQPNQKKTFKLKSTRKPQTFSNHADRPKSKVKSKPTKLPRTKPVPKQQQSVSPYQPHLKSSPSVLPSVTEKSDLKALPLVQARLKSKSRRTVSFKKKRKKKKKKKVSWSGSSRSTSPKLEVKSKRTISPDQTQFQRETSAPTFQPTSYSGKHSVEPHSEPSPELQSDPQPSSGPEPAPEPSSGPEPAPEPSSGPEPAPEPSSGPEPAPEPSSGPEPAPEPSSGSHPDPSSGPESEPQPVWDTSIQAAIRVGDWKLLTGDPGHGDWVPPQVLPSLPGRWWNLERTFSSHFQSQHQNVWLFNITADPYERQDLARHRPDVVQRLLARLAFYNQTAVPVYFPPDDPRANPSHHGGAWAPWVEEEEEEEENHGVYKKEKNSKKKKKKKKCRLCKLKSFFLKLNTGMMSNRI